MNREAILGTWKSVCYMDLSGATYAYDRQELTFRSDGTGNMHARTLFKRNTPFTWGFCNPKFFIYDLGGPGALAAAAIEGNEMGVFESGLLTLYEKV